MAPPLRVAQIGVFLLSPASTCAATLKIVGQLTALLQLAPRDLHLQSHCMKEYEGKSRLLAGLSFDAVLDSVRDRSTAGGTVAVCRSIVI